MEYYTGIKPPDKTNNKILADMMVKHLIEEVNDWVLAGASLKDAIKRTRQGTCAGVAVWKKVLANL